MNGEVCFWFSDRTWLRVEATLQHGPETLGTALVQMRSFSYTDDSGSDSASMEVNVHNSQVDKQVKTG